MTTKTMKQIQVDLQSILDECGAEDFPRTKALYLKEVQIVDSEGKPVDPEDLELSIEMKAKPEDGEEKAADEDEKEDKAVEEEEEDKAEEEEEEEKKEEEDEKKKAAAIERAVLKAVNSRSQIVKQKGMTMRIDKDREGMKRWGSLKHMSRIQTASGDSELEAYKFGRWAAACMGHRKSMDWCADRGIQTKAHLETVNSQGGFLVPDEFSNTLISLREEYGVIRKAAKIEPMTSDTKRIPMRSATMTASFVGEATAGAETNQTFQQVSLVAKKLMVLTTISNELNEDSLINLGDSVAGEIAYAFAKKEDECAFLGDSTSTYGGIRGIAASMIAESSIGINTLGGSDATVAAIDIDDLHATLAKLPNYADTPSTKWYMHKSVYSAAIEKFMYAQGGSSATELSNGLAPKLFGYDVEFVSAMPTSATAAGASATLPLRVPILFGDLSLACAFGDRRSNTISFSDSALNAFEQDEIVVRGTERFDFQVHTPGDASTAGPVVAIKLD